MNLEQEINEFISSPENKQKFLKVAHEAMEQRIQEQFKWALPDTIAKECNDFITEHVAPEVRKHLLSKKGAIIKAAKDAADNVGENIADAMFKKVEKTMSESYSANRVLDAIFK